jgi:hypothetical protein
MDTEHPAGASGWQVRLALESSQQVYAQYTHHVPALRKHLGQLTVADVAEKLRHQREDPCHWIRAEHPCLDSEKREEGRANEIRVS